MRAGHHHEAGFYASDAEFRALIVPFVEEGLACGEPIIIGYDDRKSELLRTWVSNPSGVRFIGRTLYATPARAIASYRKLFQEHTTAGAPRIRIAGDVPHEGNGGRFTGWDRYEWAVNTLWDDYPIRSVCLYDATAISPHVRSAVERTHPHLLSPSGRSVPNPRYTSAYTPPPTIPDPLESTPPQVSLTNPSPAQARRAVEATTPTALPPQVQDDLVFGTSEATTNALIHGGAPTTLRIWSTADRMLITVHDTGPGPADPYAGLQPVQKESGGLGLWLTHQLDIEVTLTPSPTGFTIRLRGGRLV